MDSPAHQAELELPDLDIITHSYQSIANELPKFRNVPAFNQGAEILNEMRGMREEMRGMSGEMRTMRGEMRTMSERIDRIDQRIDRIDQRMNSFDGRFKAMNVNNVARLINNSLIDPNGRLSPLHNVATDEPIDRFPTTPGAIKDMPAAALNTVLRALGMEIDGGLEQRRQRLRVQIGLKALPV